MAKQIENLEQKTAQLFMKVQDEEVYNRVWLKFEYSASERANATGIFVPEEWEGKTITNFPMIKNRKPSLKIDEWIYIAVVCYDKNGNPAQHIVGRGKVSSEIKTANAEMIKKFSWMERYRLYCEIREFDYINAIAEGIAVKAMIDRLGADFFESTATSSADPYKAHYQKSHIRLTGNAKTEVDRELDKLFARFGRKHKA